MILANGLKRICDISFYLTFASFLAAFFGGSNLVVTLPIFAVAVSLSAASVEKPPLNHASNVLLVLCFVIVPFHATNILALLPAVIYLIYTKPKPDEPVSQFEYVDVFKSFLSCFVALIIAALVFQWQEQLESGSLLFGLAFLIKATILMRMIRHDETILKQTRFKVMNSLSLIVVIMVVVLFSSEVFLTFVGNMLIALWRSVLAPSILFVWMGVARVIAFIFGLFNVEIGRDDAEIEIPTTAPYDMIEELPELEVPFFFFIIIGLIVAFLIFKLFQMLAQRGMLRPTNEGVVETRTTLDKNQDKKKKGRNRNNQIREVYGKYLGQLKKKEIEIAPYMTTDDIEQEAKAAFDSDASSGLRKMYINVRYGEKEFSKEDVREMKRLYKTFSGEIKGRTK